MSTSTKLQPALLIGVGGSGAKSLRTIRQTLLRRLRAGGWKKNDLPTAWQMLAIDTVTDNAPDNYPEELLPGRDYLGLVPADMQYTELRDALLRGLDGQYKLDAYAGWLPHHTNVPITRGAGQYRAIGRAVSAYSLRTMRDRIQQALTAARAPSALEELTTVAEALGQQSGGISSEVMPWVIASLAGGSGSGIFLDVAEAIVAVDSTVGQNLQVALFGPDVFEPLLNGPAGVGIPANTLASIGSITAGVWGHSPRVGTRKLYATHGVDGARSGSGSVSAGAMTNFVIGAKNSSGAVVGYLNDAYRALGENIAVIMTDPEVLHEWREYFTVNIFPASGDASKCGDESGLFTAGADFTMPFASFGSAKVSLGTDRLREFASHAIARHTIEQLLWPKFDHSDEEDDRTDEAKVNEIADRIWDTFLIRSGLNERGAADEVVDALKPANLEQRASSAATALVNRAGAAGKAMDPGTWLRNIQAVYEVSLNEFLEDASETRREAARLWVGSIADRFQTLVTEMISAYGFAVAKRLLERIREEVRFVASEQLPTEAEEQDRVARDLPGVLNRVLTESGFAAIDLNNPTLNTVKARISSAMQLSEGAQRYRLASAIMVDLEQNFLAPLEQSLNHARKELDGRVHADRLEDGRQNPFLLYPRLDESPSAAYRPATTERMLIDPDDFPAQLKGFTKRSLEENKRDRWDRELVEGAIFGRTLTGQAVADPFLVAEPRWISQVPDAQSAGNDMPTTARFRVISRPEEFVSRAALMLEDGDTALGKLLNQSLEDYLNASDPEVRNARESDFVAKLNQAFTIGSPLVEENRTLMRMLHPNARTEGNRIVCSTIPVSPQDPLYSRIQNVLTASDYWDANRSPKWFGKTNAKEVTVFQGSQVSTTALPLSSVMAPVIKQWMQLRDRKDEREGFWQFKRARPLSETVPVVPEKLNKMVMGWFVAGLLGRRSIEYVDAEKGFRVALWVEESGGWLDFPFPLLGIDMINRDDTEDILAGVLQSLLVAMAQCNLNSNLEPLRPYQALIDLGEKKSPALVQWIREGRYPAGAPEPSTHIAGPQTGTPDERLSAIQHALEQSLVDWRRYYEEEEATQDPFAMSPAWEIRDEVIAAHESLQSDIAGLHISPSSGGGKL